MGKSASRELLLLRHAKSDWYSGAASDFERPLNDRGRKEAPRMGAWLLSQNLKPDYLVSSPATRARETILAVADQLGIGERHIHWDDRLYMADPDILLGILGECPHHARRVMLVGHNPSLDDLVDYLVERDADLGPGPGILKTATLARIQLPDDWHDLSSGSGKLLALVSPKTLNA